VSVRVELDPETRTSGIFRSIRPCPGPAVQKGRGEDPALSAESPFQIRVPSLEALERPISHP